VSLQVDAAGRWDVDVGASTGTWSFSLRGLAQGRDAGGLAQVVTVEAAEGIEIIGEQKGHFIHISHCLKSNRSLKVTYPRCVSLATSGQDMSWPDRNKV
jgi:hypothetical protein